VADGGQPALQHEHVVTVVALAQHAVADGRAGWDGSRGDGPGDGEDRRACARPGSVWHCDVPFVSMCFRGELTGSR
jgi:hypothetical protein